jgi:hypothetical protein
VSAKIKIEPGGNGNSPGQSTGTQAAQRMDEAVVRSLANGPLFAGSGAGVTGTHQEGRSTGAARIAGAAFPGCLQVCTTVLLVYINS